MMAARSNGFNRESCCAHAGVSPQPTEGSDLPHVFLVRMKTDRSRF
jgi:hypothetical protein